MTKTNDGPINVNISLRNSDALIIIMKVRHIWYIDKRPGLQRTYKFTSLILVWSTLLKIHILRSTVCKWCNNYLAFKRVKCNAIEIWSMTFLNFVCKVWICYVSVHVPLAKCAFHIIRLTIYVTLCKCLLDKWPSSVCEWN